MVQIKFVFDGEIPVKGWHVSVQEFQALRDELDDNRLTPIHNNDREYEFEYYTLSYAGNHAMSPLCVEFKFREVGE